MLDTLTELQRDAVTVIVFIVTFFVALGIGRFLKRRAGVQLGLLFRLFCLIIAFYAAIAVYGVHAPWRYHVGAAAILLSTALIVALINRYVWDLYFEKRRQTTIPHFLREVVGGIIFLIVLLLVLSYGYHAEAQLKGLLAGSARFLPRESVAAQGAGLLDVGATSAGEVAALPTTLSFGRATRGSGWHATRRLVVRNLSSRRLTVEFAADRRDRGGARALVFAFAPAHVRIRPHGIATVYVAVRALAPVGDPVEGLLTIRPRGSNAIHVPWLITVRPPHDDLLSSIRLSSRAFAPSDTAPAVLSLQAGRITAGGQVEPVALLTLHLRGSDGSKLGTLAQLRDLLPGRFAFGLTGRDANGDTLEPGKYRVLLKAYPTGQGPPTEAIVPFIIR